MRHDPRFCHAESACRHAGYARRHSASRRRPQRGARLTGMVRTVNEELGIPPPVARIFWECRLIRHKLQSASHEHEAGSVARSVPHSGQARRWLGVLRSPLDRCSAGSAFDVSLEENHDSVTENASSMPSKRRRMTRAWHDTLKAKDFSGLGDLKPSQSAQLQRFTIIYFFALWIPVQLLLVGPDCTRSVASQSYRSSPQIVHLGRVHGNDRC
jgi:hypothetical protein